MFIVIAVQVEICFTEKMNLFAIAILIIIVISNKHNDMENHCNFRFG